MKFVPRGQWFSGEELHSFNSCKEPLHGCGAVSGGAVIVERFDD